MWYICYDKITGEVRRVIELSSDDKATTVTRYSVVKYGPTKPDVEVFPEKLLYPEESEREKILKELGLNEGHLEKIKKLQVLNGV